MDPKIVIQRSVARTPSWRKPKPSSVHFSIFFCNDCSFDTWKRRIAENLQVIFYYPINGKNNSKSSVKSVVCFICMAACASFLRVCGRARITAIFHGECLERTKTENVKYSAVWQGCCCSAICIVLVVQRSASAIITALSDSDAILFASACCQIVHCDFAYQDWNTKRTKWSYTYTSQSTTS